MADANDIDLKVANQLASELANENLQLRQAIIRVTAERDVLKEQLDEATKDKGTESKKK